jgi:alginate O-acetyltransferase complex protein AlgI
VLFNSPVFLVFFCVVFCAYWAVEYRRGQNLVLLAASYVFYGTWSTKFLMLLMASTLVDYFCALCLVKATAERARRRWLMVSLSMNLLCLGAFKYAGFFVQETVELLALLGFHANVPALQIVLPVGISFYTFQSLSYPIDVYRGKLAPTRSVIDFALYVAFFPQLVAGPIERATHLLPQFQNARAWSRSGFELGVQLMLFGLFKKVVIADNLSPFVDAVFDAPEVRSGLELLTATIFFAVQIYCDFSGYSDMARGIARTLGFELMVNFDYPYFSKNPVEFWQRWHISLSRWFQDYLYFPLAMRYMRVGGWASKYKAHIIAMALIGLWHGAQWTFVLFGVYWGCVIAGYLYVQERIANVEKGTLGSRVVGVTHRFPWRGGVSLIVMFGVVCGGWILFRTQCLSDAWLVVGRILSVEGGVAAAPEGVGWLWLLCIGLWLGEWLWRNVPAAAVLVDGGRYRRFVARQVLIGAVLLSQIVLQQGQIQPFIYFQF